MLSYVLFVVFYAIAEAIADSAKFFAKFILFGLCIIALVVGGVLFKGIVLDTFIVFFKEFPVMTTLVVSPFIALDIWLTRKIIKKRKQKKESEQSES